MSQNPIQDAIDTLSIPKDWRLQQITYLPTPERGTVAVAIFQPVAPDRIMTIAGVGATADEALRDAQKRVWDHADGSSRK